MRTLLCASVFVAVQLMVNLGDASAGSKPAPMPTMLVPREATTPFLILDLKSGTGEFLVPNPAGVRPEQGGNSRRRVVDPPQLKPDTSRTSIIGTFRLSVEPSPCSTGTSASGSSSDQENTARPLAQSASKLKVSKVAVTGTPVSIGGVSSRTLGLFLETPVAVDLGTIPCRQTSVPVDFSLPATLKQEAFPGSFNLSLHFVGLINLVSKTMDATVRGTLPPDVPLVGGRSLVLGLSFIPVPLSALISDRGITTYGAYTRQAVGGGTVLVNALSGNLVVDPVDLVIRGRGLSLVLERVYNAQDSTVGVFGQGWSSFLDARLESCSVAPCLQADNTFRYRDPSGAIYYFDFSTALGGFNRRIAGLQASMVDPFTIAYDDGVRLTFSPPLLVSIADRNGNTITIARDGKGTPTSITDTMHRTTMIDSDAAGRVTGVRPPGGLAAITYSYVGAHLVIVTRADQITQYDYYPFGTSKNLLKSIHNPRNFQTVIEYQPYADCGSQVAAIKFARTPDPPVGPAPPTHFDTYTYANCPGFPPLPPAGETRVTDPNGHTTTYTILDTSVFSPGPTRISDALLRKTEFTYDDNYNITDISYNVDASPDPQHKHWEYEVGELGRLMFFKHHFSGGSADLVTGFAYDDPPGGEPCLLPAELDCYLNQFLINKVTNHEKNDTTFLYDTRGNLTDVTDALHNRTHFSLNLDGTLADITQPRGGKTTLTFMYDADGLLTATTTTDPSKRTTVTTYDGLTRPATVTGPDKTPTSLAYDTLNRLMTVTYHDKTSVSFDYDPNNNVFHMTDSTGVTGFKYDHRDRQKEKRSPSSVVAYGYDGVGNLASTEDAGGAVTYVYDEVDRLTTLTEPDFETVHYDSYDENDNPLIVRYPRGLTLTREWDGLSRLKAMRVIASAASPSVVLFSLEHTYLSGSTLLESTTDTDGATTTYSYDKLNQLTDEAKQTKAGAFGGHRAWTYDADNNRATDSRGAPARETTVEYAYDDAGELLTRSSPPGIFGEVIASYSYDEKGNLIGRSDGLGLTYDAANHTISVTPPGGGAPLHMTYRGLDQTHRVSLEEGGGSTTMFSYDQAGIGPSSQTEGTTDSTSYFSRTPGGSLVSLRRAGHKYFYVLDRVGSVVALVALDATTPLAGTFADQYEYDPWGNILSDTEAEGAHQPFRFVSAEYDAPTRLYKMGARYYDPAVARFTQPGSGGEYYLYSRNDPLSLLDPTGYDGPDSSCTDPYSTIEAKGGFKGGVAVGAGVGALLMGAAIALTAPVSTPVVAVGALIAAAGGGAALGAQVGEAKGAAIAAAKCSSKSASSWREHIVVTPLPNDNAFSNPNKTTSQEDHEKGKKP